MPTSLPPFSGQNSWGPRVSVTGRTGADRSHPVRAGEQHRESSSSTHGFD